MSAERPPLPPPVMPITSIDDPRAIQILSTEHWSLLSARSLAYNEAFVRAGMFLTFLSMSFVALALLLQAMSFGRDFLSVAAIVLAFDLVIGWATFQRINGANYDDLRAVHGMARIRHAYTQVTPLVGPYFTTPTHDDMDAVTSVYGPPVVGLWAQILYGLSTSNGMIGLIVGMIGGVLTVVVAMLAGVDGGGAIWIGVVGGVLVFVGLFVSTARAIIREQGRFPAMFPTPAPDATTDDATADAPR
jgi:hypothetical protein